MTVRIDPASWAPAADLTLEPAALRAVRSVENGLVLAGPGAGKTELLAQRACYLLQTGLCPHPRRILAISFKRDAAKNLADRVQHRLGRSRAKYFDSYTFDAFAKGLLDRFLAAIPPAYRPTPDYIIDYDIKNRMRVWLEEIATADNRLTLENVSALRESEFYRDHFVGEPLRSDRPDIIERRAAMALWRLHLNAARSRVDFSMIGRLVELLLRCNPYILRGLRVTYGFVFLDEFQDTTGIQYDLLTTAFGGSTSILTAVGDNKQRIMGFAGALPKIFERFTQDFRASRFALEMNYRSAPQLVRIQQVIIESLEPGTPPAQVPAHLPPGSGECSVHIFPDHYTEAHVLSEMAYQWLTVDGLKPRDICILAREKPGEYAHLLRQELQRLGVRVRDETRLQDLLAEPLTDFVIAFFQIAVRERYPQAWAVLSDLMIRVNGLANDAVQAQRVTDSLGRFCRHLGDMIHSGGSDNAAVAAFIRAIIDYVSEPMIRHLYPQYAQGDYFSNTLQRLGLELAASLQATGNWPMAIDDFIGADSIPIMTIHKSKGLEYHTVVFIGLEDAAFRNFSTQPEDERRAFFVGFSRAKQRVLFTFCLKRSRKAGASPTRQTLGAIRSLYRLLLTQAGINPIDHRPPESSGTGQA